MPKKTIIGKKNLWVILPIVVAVVALDQLTKHWVIGFLQSEGAQQQFTSFFNLVLVKNQGMGFGFLQDYNLPPLVIVFLTAIVAVAALAVFWQADGKRIKIALSLALAGGVSNGLDRLWQGGVIDFLDFHIGDYHWPSFNLADMAISVAIFLLFLEIATSDTRRPRRRR
ncbi:MAG: signal peptidase II [Hydrotalea sp.]|nr:signal peptidase II [Hydrotalea sp.]MDI9314479.1 signal peptidase II [Hydrotalea sp.]